MKELCFLPTEGDEVLAKLTIVCLGPLGYSDCDVFDVVDPVQNDRVVLHSLIPVQVQRVA